MEAHPGAERITLKPWGSPLTLEAWRHTLEPWKLTLEPCRLTLEQ